MLNSLVSVLLNDFKSKLPMTVTDKDQVAMIMPAFIDVTSNYGVNASYSLVVDLELNNTKDSFPIVIDSMHGI